LTYFPTDLKIGERWVLDIRGWPQNLVGEVGQDPVILVTELIKIQSFKRLVVCVGQ